MEQIKSRREFHAADDAGQGKRAAARFAVLALAGELATEYGVTGWAYGEAIEAAAAGFAAWNALRGLGRGNLERDQIIERLTGFIERHGDSRFSDSGSDDDQRAAMVRDRAGWWQKTDKGRRYLFTAQGMGEALKGYDLKRALDILQDAGAIEAPGADGKRARFHRIRGHGMKLYSVDPARLNEVGGYPCA